MQESAGMHHGALAHRGSSEWLASNGGGPPDAGSGNSKFVSSVRGGAEIVATSLGARTVSAGEGEGDRSPGTASQGSSAGVEDATGAWRASIVSYGVSGPVSSSCEMRNVRHRHLNRTRR